MTKILSSIPTSQEQLTVKDFYRLVPDGQKADLIDGVIYMASPDSIEHDDLGGFLYFLLRGYVESKNLGRVSGSRFAYKLNENNAPEPDIAFVHKERVRLLHERGLTLAPDVAIEVVSPESEKRDYVKKKCLYEESGIKEYWIIDLQGMNVEFYRLVSEKYEPIPLEEGDIFRSTVLEGFWLNANWLFVSPMPNAYETLQKILE